MAAGAEAGTRVVYYGLNGAVLTSRSMGFKDPIVAAKHAQNTPLQVVSGEVSEQFVAVKPFELMQAQ